MDTIDGMRTFVTVVSEGSFSGAAEHLVMSPQLVSKYVGQLETRLNVRLLNRSTRTLSITEAGQAYYDRCRQVLADIDEMESAVGELTVKARGTLRINAPMSFGVSHLSRAIAQYQRIEPDVTISLTLNDRVVDIVSEGFDLAIRIARLGESTLVARKLAPARLVVCGAPSYFQQRGIPETPEVLGEHDCLGYTYSSDHDQWTFERDSETHKVKIKARFSANNGDALRLAAISGAGLVLLPTFIVGEDIAAGRLQRVLNDFRVEDLNIFAVYPHRQYLSAKVRTFVDFLGDYFGSPPYWDVFN
jgi:DNA-binding transcriptional LysR family regulator